MVGHGNSVLGSGDGVAAVGMQQARTLSRKNVNYQTAD